MNTALWIVQGLLAAFFGAGGIVKLVRPPKRLYDQGLTWVEDFSPGAVKVIGGLELAAAVGLVLPAVTGSVPRSSTSAAAKCPSSPSTPRCSPSRLPSPGPGSGPTPSDHHHDIGS